MDIEYTNEFLLGIMKKHIADYEKDIDNVVEVVIGGETIGDNRITTFRVITPNVHEIYENTETKTGDPIDLWS